MSQIVEQKVREYNARGNSHVVHWEPCQTCPSCGLLVDGYRREDGTCFVVCGACDASKTHKQGCRYLKSLSCWIAIECEHGLEVCPTCDPCTCGARSVSEGS